MEKLLRVLGALDWFVSAACVLAGLLMSNWWLAAGGVVSLFLAYLQPAKRIKAWLEKHFVRKRDKGADSTAMVQNDDAFYAEVLGQSSAQMPPSQPSEPARTFASPPRPYTGIYLSRSKHNQLRREHLQLWPAKELERQYF